MLLLDKKAGSKNVAQEVTKIMDRVRMDSDAGYLLLSKIFYESENYPEAQNMMMKVQNEDTYECKFVKALI
jgi:hypothetical protein